MEAGNRVTYDIAENVAFFGAATTTGPTLVWELTSAKPNPTPPDAKVLSAVVALDASHPWLIRCDRVDFPPGAVADWHTHPGPGIRRLLFGELTVTTGGTTTSHRRGDSWFESGPDPVHAVSSVTDASAFARVLLLPLKWAGRRTIRYLDPTAAQRTVRQRARVLLEETLG